MKRTDCLIRSVWVGLAWSAYSALAQALAYALPEIRQFRHVWESDPVLWIGLVGLALAGISWWALSRHLFAEGQLYDPFAAVVGSLVPVAVSCMWAPAWLQIGATLTWIGTFWVYFRYASPSLTWLLLWLLLLSGYPALLYAVSYTWPVEEVAILFASVGFLISLIVVLTVSRVAEWLPASHTVRQFLLLANRRGSLQVHIQVSFVWILLLTFALIGVFTFFFFQEQSNTLLIWQWLERLSVIYVCLLVVASIMAIAIADTITAPLSQLSERLSQTGTLHYTPLHWPRQDEIGQLVVSYNTMLEALATNVRQLAEAERESAWREMAQQVAHEIKNPLTPMRLHLQQLLRLQKLDPERAKAWSERTAHTLIEQIDVLARIATEFSHFAKLPPARLTPVAVPALLQEIATLFSQNGASAQIQLHLPPACTVHADRDQLTRVLINLVRNAMQAIPEERTGVVILTGAVTEELVTITVEDNGTGIPASIRDRIFEPRFSTKGTGAGLGLAMTKNIIDHAGGEIGFTDREPEGTTFYVRLPLLVHGNDRLPQRQPTDLAIQEVPLG